MKQQASKIIDQYGVTLLQSHFNIKVFVQEQYDNSLCDYVVPYADLGTQTKTPSIYGRRTRDKILNSVRIGLIKYINFIFLVIFYNKTKMKNIEKYYSYYVWLVLGVIRHYYLQQVNKSMYLAIASAYIKTIMCF